MKTKLALPLFVLALLPGCAALDDGGVHFEASVNTPVGEWGVRFELGHEAADEAEDAQEDAQ